MRTRNVAVESFISNVVKDIYGADKAGRSRAAAHVRNKIRAKIKKQGPSLAGEPPGMFTGNLLKGLHVANMKTVSLVGFGPPAHHAGLLEFGATGKGREDNPMAARPVLAPTMAEEAGRVRELLIEGYKNV